MTRQNVFVVMYHYVRDLELSRYPDIKGLTVRQFKQQMEFFSQCFNLITVEQLLEAKYAGGKLPPNALLLTFDDAYADHFSFVLPILQSYNYQGVFSVPARVVSDQKVLDVNKIHFILASGVPLEKILKELFLMLDYYRGREYDLETNRELFDKLAIANRFDSKEVIFVKRLLQYYLPESLRTRITGRLFTEIVGVDEKVFARELYLTYDQIKYMRQMGMYFCVHGYDHYWLDKLDQQTMMRDISSSLDFWTEIVDKNQWVMCYPYGSYNDKVIEYIANRNCVAALTTDVKVFNLAEDNIYAIPRLDTNDFPPKSKNYEEIAT